MVFPDLKTELKINGAWVDATAYSYTRDPARITRGRADETSQVVPPPASMTCTLDNRDGRFSPRNPNGVYYGQIGRNQPFRASVPGDGSKACRLPGTYGTDNVTTPDTAALHIVGDIDIRVDVTLDNALQYQTLAVKGDWGNGSSATNLGWVFYLSNGQLRFSWSANGTTAAPALGAVPSTAGLTASQTGTRIALRVTMDVDDGSGNRVVTFYTAPTISGSWTQLGSAVTTAGTTSIFASTAQIQLGDAGDNARTLNLSIAAGRLHAFQLLNGIGGSAVANPDFTTQSIGTTSFADAAGRTWTLNGDCEITDRLYRFYGEMAELPQRWDVSGKDVTTLAAASGILRRLGQGTTPVSSPLKRAITSSATRPIAYWPCEDAVGSTSIASASSAQAMTITGSPSLAGDSHIGGSAPLPTPTGSSWAGIVPSYSLPSTNSAQLSFVYYANTALANNATLLRITTTTTRFDFNFWSGGPGFYINVYDAATGTLVGPDNSGTDGFNSSLTTAYAGSISIYQSGSAIGYAYALGTGSNRAWTTFATIASRQLGRVVRIDVNPSGTVTDTVIGHLAVYAPELNPSLHSGAGSPDIYRTNVAGNAGETAGRRFIRLCLESGIQPRTWGDPDDSPAMGGQGSDTLLNLLTACAEADGGLLAEPRDVLGIGMRMRSSLFDETSSVTLSHSSGHLSPPLEPTDDDQQTRNYWTYTNSTTGNAVVASLDQGAMSTANPPAGVGRYADQKTLNLADDTLLDDLTTWAVHVGTVNEQRFPAFTCQLEAPAFGAASSALSQSVQKLDIGQVATLTGWPAGQSPDDARQLIQGTTEIFTAKSWFVTFNASPASPYDVLLLDDGTAARLDLDGSTLHDATINSSATSFQVDTDLTVSGGCLWSTTDTPYDIRMGGEVMTVTAVTGSSSPQTFTVTRSVNGVVKAHSSGETISLARPFYLAPY